jgi:hypothetical protein
VGGRVEPPGRAGGVRSGQAGDSSHLWPSTGDDTRCSTRTLAACLGTGPPDKALWPSLDERSQIRDHPLG